MQAVFAEDLISFQMNAIVLLCKGVPSGIAIRDAVAAVQDEDDVRIRFKGFRREARRLEGPAERRIRVHARFIAASGIWRSPAPRQNSRPLSLTRRRSSSGRTAKGTVAQGRARELNKILRFKQLGKSLGFWQVS